MKVLIAGASGVVGTAALKRFASIDGCEVLGASRRPLKVEGVTHIPVDLSDRRQCEEAFGALDDVTHVVYAALWDGAHWVPSLDDYLQGNLAMLRNVLEPVEEASSVLEHVSVLHGAKVYAMHFEYDGTVRPRLRETDVRVEHDSFYFLQEDYLIERQEGRRWAWTIWRPTNVFGETLGAPMNVIPAIGVYGALLREQGEPLHFPGNANIRVVREACDSELLADVLVWAAGEPKARNEIYNVSNGDQFEWYELWEPIAHALGMERGEVKRFLMAEEIPRRQDEWRAIVDKHGLRADPDPMAIGGASFEFIDMFLGATRPDENICAAQLLSTIKLRQHGFHQAVDTGDMVAKWFGRLQDDRILPKPD